MAFMRRVKQRFSLENLPWASSGRAKAGGDDSEDVSAVENSPRNSEEAESDLYFTAALSEEPSASDTLAIVGDSQSAADADQPAVSSESDPKGSSIRTPLPGAGQVQLGAGLHTHHEDVTPAASGQLSSTSAVLQTPTAPMAGASADAGTATPPMYTPPASRAAALVGDGLSFLGGMLASEDSPTRLARRSFPGVIPSASTAPTATIAQKQRAQQQTHSKSCEHGSRPLSWRTDREAVTAAESKRVRAESKRRSYSGGCSPKISGSEDSTAAASSEFHFRPSGLSSIGLGRRESDVRVVVTRTFSLNTGELNSAHTGHGGFAGADETHSAGDPSSQDTLAGADNAARALAPSKSKSSPRTAPLASSPVAKSGNVPSDMAKKTKAGRKGSVFEKLVKRSYSSDTPLPAAVAMDAPLREVLPRLLMRARDESCVERTREFIRDKMFAVIEQVTALTTEDEMEMRLWGREKLSPEQLLYQLKQWDRKLRELDSLVRNMESMPELPCEPSTNITMQEFQSLESLLASPRQPDLSASNARLAADHKAAFAVDKLTKELRERQEDIRRLEEQLKALRAMGLPDTAPTAVDAEVDPGTSMTGDGTGSETAAAADAEASLMGNTAAAMQTICTDSAVDSPAVAPQCAETAAEDRASSSEIGMGTDANTSSASATVADGNGAATCAPFAQSDADVHSVPPATLTLATEACADEPSSGTTGPSALPVSKLQPQVDPLARASIGSAAWCGGEE